jgi:hypothetical protein
MGSFTKLSHRAAAGVLLLFLSVYLMTAMGHFYSSDHVSVYLTTASLVDDHRLAIRFINDEVKGVDGEYYSVFGIGQSILSIPLYLAGRWVDSLHSPFLQTFLAGTKVNDFTGTIPIFFVSLLNQLLTPFVCLLVLLFCLRLGFSFKVSLATTLIFGFSTLAWALADEYFQHPLESLLLLFSVYILFAHRDRIRPIHAFLSGVALALGLLARIDLLWLIPAVGGYALYTASGEAAQGVCGSTTPMALQCAIRRLGRGWRHLLSFGLPVVLAFSFLLWFNQLRFGDWLAFNPSASRAGYSLFNLPVGLYGNLFSVGRSIFLYSPPVVLAFFTFSEFRRHHPAEAALFIAIACIYLLTYSAYGGWDGGLAWGPRFLLPAIPFLVIPLGYFPMNRLKVSLAVLFALAGAGIQFLGVVVSPRFVWLNWAERGFNPANAEFYVPNLSAIPAHLRSLLAHRNIDLWLVQIYRQFGVGGSVLTLAVLVLLLLTGVALILTSPEGVLSRQAKSVGIQADAGPGQRATT